MKTITFVRHGQSTANAGGITQADHAIALSPLGKLHAQALAAELTDRPSTIFVSIYQRTQETAQPFCEKMSMQPHSHPLLHEFSPFDASLLASSAGRMLKLIGKKETRPGAWGRRGKPLTNSSSA